MCEEAEKRVVEVILESEIEVE